MRNIGGSVGISIVQTLLVRHQQLHHNELVQHAAPTSPSYQQNLQHYTQVFSNFASSSTAHQQAIGQVGRMLDQQAQLWSYVDDLRYMALACFCCVPLVWGLKKVRAKAMPAGAH